MKKLNINYSRSFPDHRVFADAKIYQKVKLNPIENFKFWKLETAHKVKHHIHVYISLLSILAFTYVSLKCSQDMKEIAYRNNSRPALRYGHLSNEPGIGRYDRITNRFENDRDGIYDWN